MRGSAYEGELASRGCRIIAHVLPEPHADYDVIQIGPATLFCGVGDGR
jgi:hypothetical protein